MALSDYPWWSSVAQHVAWGSPSLHSSWHGQSTRLVSILATWMIVRPFGFSHFGEHGSFTIVLPVLLFYLNLYRSRLLRHKQGNSEQTQLKSEILKKKTSTEHRAAISSQRISKNIIWFTFAAISVIPNELTFVPQTVSVDTLVTSSQSRRGVLTVKTIPASQGLELMI